MQKQSMSLRPISPAFVLATLVVFSSQVQAQFAPQSVFSVTPGAPAAASTGAPAAAGMTSQATAIDAVQAPTGGQGLDMSQRPDMSQRQDMQRPDLGAADAQRALPTAVQTKKARSSTQFQRFVQSSTGQLLPHFGEQLFDNPNAYATDAAAPAPDEYVLGPGDQVRIQIWGSVDFAGSQTLDRNGQISLPKIGVINLNGVQVKNLETTLRKQVGTVFNNISLNASLGKLRGITVYVVGQAQQPGTYNLNSLSTLVNALFASGGPSNAGSMRNIELKRAGKTITTLDLYDFIAKGDKSKDAPLQPGDVIMIPPAGPRVALTGATDHAAIYELKNGNTVQDVLALSGGLPSLATAQKALLERIVEGQNTPRQVQDLSLNASGLATPMRDGDVVTLLGISPAFANAVTLQGNVAAPLRYVWRSGMRILDLIPEREALITADYYVRKNLLVQSIADSQNAGKKVSNRVRNMVDQINWDYAIIERLNKFGQSGHPKRPSPQPAFARG
jgi:protein involved in polysaccharide export with SLBB domain